MYACEGRVCLEGTPLPRVSPLLPTLCRGHESVCLCPCSWYVAGPACVLARVCVDVAWWAPVSGGIHVTRYSAHVCRVWREGCVKCWLFPSLLSGQQLKAT